jgi:hypothetical protein
MHGSHVQVLFAKEERGLTACLSGVKNETVYIVLLILHIDKVDPSKGTRNVDGLKRVTLIYSLPFKALYAMSAEP